MGLVGRTLAGWREGRGRSEQVRQEHGDARARLVMALQGAISERGMTQVQAARLLRTDQPTLSKVVRGRTDSVSLDKLIAWLLVLGRSVEIRVYEPTATALPSFTAIISGASND